MAATDRVCNYLDMPIQHASDKMLKSMRRGLNQEGIRKRIAKLRSANPGIVLRTTLIVGYPGETEDEFNDLYDFVKEIRFDRLGVFTYSEEEGTLAASLEDNVTPELKDERKGIILDLQAGISAEKNQEFIGQTLKVLVDEIGRPCPSDGQNLILQKWTRLFTLRVLLKKENSVRYRSKTPMSLNLLEHQSDQCQVRSLISGCT